MRVLVVTNMYPSDARPSSGTFVKEQVDDLRRLGVVVDVLAFDGETDPRNYLRATRALWKAVRTNRFDIVHAHYGLTGLIAVSQRRRPVVTTFHGGDYTGLVRWHALVSRVVARLSTPVVVAPEGAQRLRVPTAAVIPAGVDTDRFRPGDRAQARRSLGLAVDGTYALLLGARADPNKRADLFDAAVARARETVPGLSPLSLEGLDRSQVVALMNAVDVSVMTSDLEGSPVAVRESLACLTPVVAVPAGNVGEMLAGLPGCAVVPRDPEQLGTAIVAALAAGRDPALRERALESSGRAVAERLVRVYESVLARRRA